MQDPIGIRHAYALLLPEQLALIALVMLRTLLFIPASAAGVCILARRRSNSVLRVSSSTR